MDQKISCLCPTFFRPDRLFDAIFSFLRQDYTNKRLLICDDTGTYQEMDYRGVQIVRTRLFRTLPEKYNAMVGMSDPDAQIYAVWEDDDLYLPWHLNSIAATLKLFGGPAAYHHQQVLSDDGQKMRIEETGGRFHASLGFNRKCFEETGGWKVTPEASFDLQLIARLGPHIKASYQQPSYYFRWGSSGSYHGQSAMSTYHDPNWTNVARENLKKCHADKMRWNEQYRFQHYCLTDGQHVMLKRFIDWAISGVEDKEYDFAHLLQPIVRAVGGMESLSFDKLNSALQQNFRV